MRVRIEATLAVEDVVRQLCISVKIKDPPNMYALRDEADELVTNENLKKKIMAKVNLKCVSFPFRALVSISLPFCALEELTIS